MSQPGDVEHMAAEKFMIAQLKWTFEISAETAIECFKKNNIIEKPYRSPELLKFIKQIGGLSTVIIYLEYLCLECVPTAAKLNENLRESLLQAQKS